MPEIAEVRTVAKVLNKSIVGKKIIGIDVIYDGIIDGDIKKFKDSIKGQTFTCVSNYGKWLFLVLGDLTIMSHLRMEGKYFYKDSVDEIEKHEHIIFHLDDNHDLRYHDTRKFGVMKLVKTEEIYKTKEISKLGVEPDNPCLTGEYIYNSIHKLKGPIKSAMLDQTIINGLGNIYADEVLFAAGIKPEKECNKISLKSCNLIAKAGKTIIPKATKLGGTTIRSYTSSLGVKGSYQDYLCVHTRVGCPCPVCGSTIKKIRVGGRGTYFCPKCQK